MTTAFRAIATNKRLPKREPKINRVRDFTIWQFSKFVPDIATFALLRYELARLDRIGGKARHFHGDSI